MIKDSNIVVVVEVEKIEAELVLEIQPVIKVNGKKTKNVYVPYRVVLKKGELGELVKLAEK